MSHSDTPAFVDDYLAALLAQASALISSEFHEVVRANGFSVSEWRVLATLAGGKTISIGGLAQISTLKQPTVTRLLDRMEARGHIERIAHEIDRRITLIRITPGGQEIVSALITQAKEHESRVLEPFGANRAEELKEMLHRIIDMHRKPS